MSAHSARANLRLFPEPKYDHLYEIHNLDSFEWLRTRETNSIHAVITDPPYGLLEYSEGEKRKLRSGRGGVWRIPPSFDGCERRPVPRFTVLKHQHKADLEAFFSKLATLLYPVLVPGAHVFIATNPLVSHFVYGPFIRAGYEKRGEIIRTVQTLRGGDRPKNAHKEFAQISVMPRSCWEPWGLFRKPCEGRVQDNLRRWRTGGLRRISADTPFRDMIVSCPTRRAEHRLAPHPSLKPQQFLRQLARAALPFGEGTILDPYMGSGSTIAACAALGLRSIGIEIDADYFAMSRKSIPKLSLLEVKLEEANGSAR